MPNPLIKSIESLFKDPTEQVGIGLPSAALVALFFSYRQDIHPSLARLPDPFSASTSGALIFLVMTLAVSLVVKRLSHDLLNTVYDRLYRDRKRRLAESWYARAQNLALSTNDPLLSKYQEALERLRDNANPVVARVDALQTQSKLARSLTLIVAIFSLALAIMHLYLLALVCGGATAAMLVGFFNERWQASELVYQALCETYFRQERRQPRWTSPIVEFERKVTRPRNSESIT